MDQKVDKSRTSEALGSAQDRARQMPLHRSGLGLSAKLLVLTTLFVMVAEVLIFVPSIANFRLNWLNDRLMSAQLASLAAQATPDGNVPPALRAELLRTAQVKAVALKRNDQRQLVLEADMPQKIDMVYNLSEVAHGGFWARFGTIDDALGVLLSSGDRTLRIIGQPGNDAGQLIDMVLPEAPLQHAMRTFGLNVLLLSIIISVFTAALVYMALNAMFVRPMMRVAHNMVRFAEQPEDGTRIITPSRRTDEIGTAERELANMQTELNQLLGQKSRLAALGLAVSKINHDLRNLLANTQLLSDRLTSSPDPTVQRFAPKLIASLDRAIAFCNDTLAFGRAAERPPSRKPFRLAELAQEIADGFDLPREGGIGWQTRIAANLDLDADRDQIFRVLNNLVRNALQALEGRDDPGSGEISITADRTGNGVRILLSDNGPGLPAKARERLFQPFQGAQRRGGTGLGLAIAHELVAAHGGTLRYLETSPGAHFEIFIPDRNAD
ncbi:MAG: sensor histidine kinase [Hyphomicrobiaceae bacterium]